MTHAVVATVLFLMFLGQGDSAKTELKDGLVLKLESDQKTLVVGEKVILRTTLVNHNPIPVSVSVGRTSGGIQFVNGSAFRAYGSPCLDDIRGGRGIMLVGHCATGSVPIVVTLEPSGTVSYECVVEYGRWMDPKKGQEFLMLGGQTAFKMTLPCKLAFRTTFKVTTNSYYWNKHRVSRGAEIPKISDAIWTGKVESNEITLEVVPSTQVPPRSN